MRKESEHIPSMFLIKINILEKYIFLYISETGGDLKNEYFLQEMYNTTIDNVWQFVPKFHHEEPFNTVICLIWTPPYQKTFLNETTNVRTYLCIIN